MRRLSPSGMLASSASAQGSGLVHENMTDMVVRRQEPLRKLYRERPDQAQITDHARTANVGRNPFHGQAITGDSQISLDFGIHRAIGGDHDLPNPGDMLCAALAACLDSTLRMIAARMGIALETLVVEVKAFADVRGCLMMDRQVLASIESMSTCSSRPKRAPIPRGSASLHQPLSVAASFSRPCVATLRRTRGSADAVIAAAE
jgi:organic hydroperoxide reductase OsmC/OhrA